MSAAESLLFSMKNTPRMTSSATRPPTTEPIMICFFLRAFAASARCSARVFVEMPFCGFGTASNWPVTGLNACVTVVSPAGVMATVFAVHFGLLACLHIGQIGQRIERGRHRHAAVHERQQIVLEFGSRGVTVLTILRHRLRANRIPHFGKPGTTELGGVATSETCW